MRTKLPYFMSEVPKAPDYNPTAAAISSASDASVKAVLRQFLSLPASTGVFANPVRHRRTVECNASSLELHIRSFALRGCLLEEDVVSGSADYLRAIFVGLFGRFATAVESRSFVSLLAGEFNRVTSRVLPLIAKFMKTFPNAAPDVSIRYVAAMRRASGESEDVNSSRPRAELLRNLIRTHLENAATGSCSSYLRFLLSRRARWSAAALSREARLFMESVGEKDPFHVIFSLLLRRPVNAIEAGMFGRNGAIQIHHGSAGSNMVARYLASLHAKSISDLFIAAQTALDGARHFGAIGDLSTFIELLGRASPRRRDDLIRQRAVAGNIPAFGHPEIATAGRSCQVEIDPRAAIYLSSLFSAIDSGKVVISEAVLKRVTIAQRIYQLAFVEGIEKPGRPGALRIAPNTDFGTWIIHEVLGIDEADRTFPSYVFRGFGWMMDIREQLQQPIIRPVIPPDPAIVPASTPDDTIPGIVVAVHNRLSRPNAFAGA